MKTSYISGEFSQVIACPRRPCASITRKAFSFRLGRSYAKILQHANEQKFAVALPTREVYVKGPGLIFKGNPKSDLTEIQLPFKD